MRSSFAFAVTLHRVFDSAPPKEKAAFYSGNKQLFPVEKPNGLYVFLENAENPVTILCAGFMPQDVNIPAGNITATALYPNAMLALPAGWRSVTDVCEPEKLVYCADTRLELKLAEYSSENSLARIRSRKGFTGGCLLFSSDEVKEIALILEKQPPDTFYLSKLSGDYINGTVCRVYCARSDAEGRYCLVVPESLQVEAVEYL